MNHSTAKPNQAQAWRLEQLASMPCIACAKEDCEQPNRTEVHHLVDKGTRKLSGGHDATIPLCGWHHRGEPMAGMSTADMAFYHGPSFALSKKSFVELYGTERELLAEVDAAL
jgi:hypothetical protein